MDDNSEFHSIYLPHLINYVVPVLQHKNNKIEIGSGILVKAGQRHFVATAKHCIDADVRVLRSVSPIQKAGEWPMRPLPILQKGWHDTLDVGFLEINDPEWTEIGWEQLCTDRIVDGPVHVIGYPEVLVQAVETKPGVLTDISVAPGMFTTSLIEDTDNRMAFDYPKIGFKYDEAAGTWSPSPFPTTPRGFSGGACFGVAKPLGSVSIVEYKLLGIQYAWDEVKRVFVVPIKHWQELLIKNNLYSQHAV